MLGQKMDRLWESRIVGRGNWRIYEAEDGQAVGIIKMFGEDENREQRGIAEIDRRGSERG